MKVAIVGAGMAGLACAEALVAERWPVAVFDKGRAPGGRMSTRRLASANVSTSFDHGAQYFTARDPAFRARVEQWRAAGLAMPWPAAGADAWVGTPGMNAPVSQMAAGLDVRRLTLIDALDCIDGRWRLAGEMFDAALVAVPAEQASLLLQPWNPAFAAKAAATASAPCWTVMVAFAERVPFDADVVRSQGTIGWAARNSAKPGRADQESWVIQAGPDWSRAHLEEDAAAVATSLLAAFAELIGAGLPQSLSTVAHRWRYARSGSSGDGSLWDPALRLGVCGDWLLGPRVEAAWLSGTRLASMVAQAA